MHITYMYMFVCYTHKGKKIVLMFLHVDAVYFAKACGSSFISFLKYLSRFFVVLFYFFFAPIFMFNLPSYQSANNMTDEVATRWSPPPFPLHIIYVMYMYIYYMCVCVYIIHCLCVGIMYMFL
jgi:hypothetical protein